MHVFATIVLAIVVARPLAAQTTSVYGSSEEFARHARELRQRTLDQIAPKVFVPTTSSAPGVSGRYPWKSAIVTEVFHIGQRAGGSASAWDPKWKENYGGLDNPDPAARRDFIPTNLVPRLNPFYAALPYNDITGEHFKPEAKGVIPWFRQAFERDGKSVCRDRWVAVRKGGKVCYAQWSDCGPYRSDHWEYVFGNDRPRPNTNRGAGLSVSPAVRDYLGLASTDVTDWKFLEARDVPSGPWARWGDNNTVVQLRGRTSTSASARSDSPTPKTESGPAVIITP